MKKEKVLDFFRNPLSIISPEVKAVLKYKKNGSALDLGSGGGRNAFYLAKKGFDVTVLDSKKENLTKLKESAQKQEIALKYKHADIAEFKSSLKYDLVLAISSLHFLKGPQVTLAIKRMKGYTKIGGLNVITVHTKKNVKKTHHRPHLFANDELKKYYKDWEILEYSEEWGNLFKVRLDAEPVRKHKAVLIAKKLK